MKRILLFLLAILPLIAFGQKKALDHSVYDEWKSLRGPKITNDAKFISYEINPQQGDGDLFLYNVKDKGLDSFSRAYSSVFSPGSEYFVFKVKAEYDSTRQAKKDKLKPDEMPKDNIGIKILPSGDLKMIERVKSFKLPADEGNWMAYLMEKPLPEKKKKDEGAEKEEKAETEEKPAQRINDSKKDEKKSDGTELHILNPLNDSEQIFQDVISYEVSDNGSVITYVQTTKDTNKIEHFTVSIFNTTMESSNEIFSGEGGLKSLITSKNGDKFAFIYTSDTCDVKVYDLYYSDGGAARKIIDIESAAMPEGWSVSENGNLSFSESGKRLFFGTAEKPLEEAEDSLLADEKYKLDIWSWQDPLLQPQQKKQLSSEKKRNYQAVYHIDEDRMIQLADTEMPTIRLLKKKDGDLAIGSSSLKYRMFVSWDANRYSDYYLVDINTGERKMLVEKAASSVSFSPSGENMLFWCIDTKNWFAKSTEGDEWVNLTGKLDVDFYNELHDSPSEPRPYGVAAWLEGENYVLVNDRYDIWKMDLSGKEAPIMITNGHGRLNDINYRYSRLGISPADKEYLSPKETIYLAAFNEKTKDAGLFTLKLNKPAAPLKIIMEPYSYRSFTKAEDKDVLIWQKGNIKESPELYISDMKLSDPAKISETNPQQADYNWGTSEIVEWTSFDGQELQGILYKPENFDPAKKYPMVVYFYERGSNGLHRYISPAPSASTINKIYALSNGYLVFDPDIPYVEGFPGHSCYNSVVSGTHALLERFDYIDKTKLGLDGQSWGGYQIAYLITKTDLFACAFSGAPVSNMTSAYGGIRWGSGMSRMFQYEKTQSRIGGTLWEKPIHYIENSPLFFVPNINTPVLIMHNDSDGAVPWYQGIEFFVALRRLSKPAWMLTYNDEQHNLRKRPNRKDLSVRKMQFFDHYLMDAPMPYWMEKGISQMEKGKIDGYELMK